MTRPLGGRCVPRATDSNIVGHGVVDSCSPAVEGREWGLLVWGELVWSGFARNLHGM